MATAETYSTVGRSLRQASLNAWEEYSERWAGTPAKEGLDLISEQWDRMGQLYASLKTGHVTASVALKRLVAFSAKNRFYRANRELGRIFKTCSCLTLILACIVY